MAITAASGVNKRAIHSGTVSNTIAAADITAAPSPSAVHPARAAACRSPRPSANPTRTAAAELMPSGIMNVVLTVVRAIWCPASAVAFNSAHQHRHGGEHADLYRHLPGRRRSQLEQRPHPRRIRPPGNSQDFRVAFPQNVGQRTRHVDARKTGGPAGSFRAQPRRSQMTQNQQPISGQIHQVRREQRDHHRPRHVQRLQITPQREVDQQRRRAPDQGVKIRPRRAQHLTVDSQVRQDCFQRPDRAHHHGNHQHGHPHAGYQGAVAIFAISRAECLRDQCVEPQQQAARADRDPVEHHGAQAHRADRFALPRGRRTWCPPRPSPSSRVRRVLRGRPNGTSPLARLETVLCARDSFSPGGFK